MRKRDLKKSKNSKGAFRLPFLFTIFLTIICYSLLTPAATGQDLHHIRLHAQSFPARCQANGIIECTLSDTAGLFLEQIRYTYTPLSGIDSIVETTLPRIEHLRPGDYRISVSALYRTGLGHGDAYQIVFDTINRITVGSLYQIPTCGVQRNIYSSTAPYGTVPSLRCAPTGKIQLLLQKGTFPYTVSIWKIEGSDTLPYRTIVYDTNQNAGTSPLAANYQHYYTIDSLEVGQYQLLCHDGCGYYMPLLYAEVPSAALLSDVHRFHLRNSSFDPRSHNLIVFKETLAGNLLVNNPSYYYYNSEEPMFEYRFVNPTLTNTRDTTPWRPLPPFSATQPVYLTDTLSILSCYGEAWMKQITLQYRPIVCPDTIWSSTYTIYPQGGNLHREFPNYYTIGGTHSWFDYCYRHNATPGYLKINRDILFIHEMNEVFSYLTDSLNQNNNHFYTEAGGIPSTATGMRYHSYITHPIRYRVIDCTTSEVIVQDTLSTLSHGWKYYYTKDASRNGHTLCAEITDYNGCPLYAATFTTILDSTYTAPDTTLTKYVWRAFSENDNRCSDSKRSAILSIISTEYDLGGNRFSYSGDTLYLIESPEFNRYNFRAYSDRKEHFIIERDRLDNLAEIGYYRMRYPNSTAYYPAIRLNARNLPSGRYVWVVVHPCDRPNDTIVQDIVFPESPVILEAPRYQFIQECTQLKIVPIAGRYEVGGTETQTFFQAHISDTLTHSLNSVQLGDTIALSVPGSYLLSMYALPLNNASLLGSNPCYITDTIITWDARTIEYDYIISYVCNAEDTIGFVRARGQYGLRPHTYTLYDAPNGTGNILGQNDTGDFNHLPIHFGQQLSIDMRDRCNAHFLTNFIVSDMEHIRKAWMENNSPTATLYEGDTCHLYSISMGDVNYHWTGPNDFQEETQRPTFRIPNGPLAAGTYTVAIEGSGCSSARDSVQLLVIQAPSVKLQRDTIVCPNTEVPIYATVTGDSTITYTLVKDAFGRRDTFLFADRHPGQTDTLRTLITDDNTRFYISKVQDRQRAYFATSDTVHVRLISEQQTLTLHSTSDTICRGNDATLTASVNILPPYIVQWSDFADGTVIQNDTIGAIGSASRLQLNNIEQEKTYTVRAIASNNCPQRNGIFQEVAMSNQTVTVSSNRGIRFHDSGGASAAYGASENSIITFTNADSSATLSLQFEYFNCSDASGLDSSDVLYIFDGASTDGSPLRTLRGRLIGEDLPQLISSSGSFTCWFISNHSYTEEPGAYEGWSAVLHSTDVGSGTAITEATSVSAIRIKGASSSETRVIEIMESELPYEWDGLLFTHADTLIERLTNLSGCDSTIIRILKVKSLAPCPTAIDYDGNEYNSIRIGAYCWTQTNLTSKHYSDGRAIIDASGYFADIHPDSTLNIQTFGRLYDWYASVDTSTLTLTPSGHRQGICPSGWYLPTAEQYETLNELGSFALRSSEFWLDGGGNNSSGFTSLPAGFYCGEHQRFENLLGEAYFWADSETDFSENSIYVFGNAYCNSLQKILSDQHNRYSIRCIFDE